MKLTEYTDFCKKYNSEILKAQYDLFEEISMPGLRPSDFRKWEAELKAAHEKMWPSNPRNRWEAI